MTSTTWQEQDTQASDDFDVALTRYSTSASVTSADRALYGLVIALQHELDSLRLRLFGDPDSGGTDGGEVGRLQRDVAELTQDTAQMLSGVPGDVGHRERELARERAAQPHRQPTDEQATYSV